MELAARYLELLKKCLLDELYIENEARLLYVVMSLLSNAPIDEEVLREITSKRPDLLKILRETRADGTPFYHVERRLADGTIQSLNIRNVSEFYHTMIGRKRLDNLHALLDRVMADGIPGDLIETGVWRGGACIFMRGYLAAHGITERTVWAADSFAGLPSPSLSQDHGLDLSRTVHPILAIRRDDVEDLFRRYDLMDQQVRFIEGWFKDTLPDAPIDRLALIRLDGDMYESTMDGLLHLYPKLSPGGYVIVDDYGILQACRNAVDEYRQRLRISSPIEQIDHSGVFWRKQA